MIVKVQRKIRLPDIVGVSPQNSRQQVDDADLPALAENILANGLFDEIFVERDDGGTIGYDAGAGFYVLDGSRRWRAFLHLAEQGRIAADCEIDVVEVIGSDADKAELAFAVNFHRMKLHPVEEFEAFARMARAGRSEGEIAKSFKLEIKDVLRSLALGRMAIEIRDAWKCGVISESAARAYASERDQTKQLHAFLSLSGENRNDPATIKRILRGDAIIASHSIAVYVRADYVAAGGTIEDNLFDDQAFLIDGPLAREIAAKKLRDAAAKIREAQGWSFGLTEFDGAVADSPAFVRVAEADYSQKDQARLDAIEAMDLTVVDAAAREELAREAEQIELRAWSRGVSKGERANLGFVLSLDQDGSVVMDGGLKRVGEKSTAQAMADALDDADRDQATRERSSESAPVSPPPPAAFDEKRQVRAIRDAALSLAIGDCASRNVNLALAIVVAAFQCAGRDIVGMISSRNAARAMNAMRRAPHDLLDEIAGLPFDVALTTCVRAPAGDLATAFAALVARSIDVGDFDDTAKGAIVLAVGHISAIAPALDRAFDRAAYFDAAAKEAVLAAIGDMQGTPPGDIPGSRKGLAEYAAQLAQRKEWLPAPWPQWLAAIEARHAEPAPNAKPVVDLGAGKLTQAEIRARDVQRFIEERTRTLSDHRIQAADLHAAFLEWCIAEEIESPAAIGQFGRICREQGLQRFHSKVGTFYLNLALRAPAAAIAEAAE